MTALTEAEEEVLAAIRYYEARGWDWLEVVAFISARALGTLPADVLRSRRDPLWRRART